VFVAPGLTFLIGEVLFGISVIRAGVFSKIASLAFMAGMISVALHLTGIFPETLEYIASIVAGSDLLWWSVELFQLADPDQ